MNRLPKWRRDMKRKNQREVLLSISQIVDVDKMKEALMNAYPDSKPVVFANLTPKSKVG
jgi:hypothetical protein